MSISLPVPNRSPEHSFSASLPCCVLLVIALLCTGQANAQMAQPVKGPPVHPTPINDSPTGLPHYRARIGPTPLPSILQPSSGWDPNRTLNQPGRQFHLEPNRHSEVVRGALIGAGAGALVLATVVALHHDRLRESRPGLAIEIPVSLVAPGVIGALIGTAQSGRRSPSAGQRSSSHALVGTGLGAAAGTILGAWTMHRFCSNQSSFEDDPCIRYAAFGGNLGALIGGMMGYGFGGMRPANQDTPGITRLPRKVFATVRNVEQ